MPRFPAATSLLINAINHRVFPGAAFGVLQNGERLAAESVGGFTYEADAPRVRPDTIFDLASVSKAIATTAMAMLLWERGQLDLDQPVGERLPEFVVAAADVTKRKKVTARMLLTHCSGLPAYAALYKTCRTASELLDACMKMPLESNPESHAVYSDIGFIVVGRLLEIIAGETLDSFCQREIFGPLGMNSTMYRPPDELRGLIPPTSSANNFRHRALQGEVHDGNCWRLGGVSGHAGVFSDVADLLRLADCLLRGGNGLFRPDTISKFTARQNVPAGSGWALGWDTPTPPSSAGNFFSAHSVGHLGYTGTSLWIDFEKELAVGLLTNRTFPESGGERASAEMKIVRSHFHDALMRELG
ncbi:MAG: serine hydrolase domain-containing protein [Acidobacteriaceae bacterium]